MEINPTSGFETGQNLQIFGTGFSSDPSKIQVSVDNVPCDVESSTLSSISCRLRPKQPSDSSLILIPPQNTTSNTTNSTN